MANRLAHEISPYLLQHAHNPVDWYPWGEEAFRTAREENKPIFLSVGYAACHWCHVMAHESFEDEDTAALLNEHYVCVKVDREERPDVDSVYMQAVVAMTQHGGWPMSVWMTPAGEPFYAGTYFPPTPRYGMPSFRHVLTRLATAWREQPEVLRRSTDELVEYLRREEQPPAPGGLPDASTAAQALAALDHQFDWEHGGWGHAPKFPQAMVIDALLAHHVRTGATAALALAERTLTMMAEGGIYDHLGGGFHRYSVDELWLIPHFEKMLYDNAQLARTYVHAWQVTGKDAYRRVAEETLDYLLTRMRDPAGGFFSSEDADTEGMEGRYYVWTQAEVEEVLRNHLGDEVPPEVRDPELFFAVYGVTDAGNFESTNVLHVARQPAEVALEAGIPEAALAAGLAAARRALRAARERRVPPGVDYKVLASWNGLALAAFAEAATAFGRDDYLQAARMNGGFLLTSMLNPEGRLLRSFAKGQAQLPGFLEDYACVAEGLLALYEADFDERWFLGARSLANAIITHFRAPQGGFFDTADDHEELLVRPRDLQDNAVPSGNAMAATVLFRLARLTGDDHYTEAAEAALSAVTDLLPLHPTAFGRWLAGLEFTLAEPVEVAVAGPKGCRTTGELLKAATRGFRPGRVVAYRDTTVGQPSTGAADTVVTEVDGGKDEGARAIPLLEGRHPPEGGAAAWVCRSSSCRAPVTSAEELSAEMPGG
jgi:hypothetical protein